MSKLALLGGTPVIQAPLHPYNSIGEKEVIAATAVIRSGYLSDFLGSSGPKFRGGEKVQALEAAWTRDFGVQHAVSVNSATSGLVAAIGALGVEPGDEVIVSPWTMCATATCILAWNAIPVFADIEPDTFNLDPASVEACITTSTRAIVVPDIFGHAAALHEIMAIARRHDLKVIEDAAQSPGALYHGRKVGTIADIGVFSLNYHKHIHTGEGGICVTNDAALAQRLMLIRNHAEAAVTPGTTDTDLVNMIGFNFRMTEIEAAIGVEQLKKLDTLVAQRQRAAQRLSQVLADLPGIRPPVVKSNCSHVYYVYPTLLNCTELAAPRATIHAALEAEGVTGLASGYANCHLLPIYQRRIAYGRQGYPWTSPDYRGTVSYDKGICPVAEELHDASFLGLEFCLHTLPDKDTDRIAAAFCKVWQYMDELRNVL